MTIKQLKDELSKYPDNMDVYLAERKTEFAFGLVNSAYTKEITFSEDEEGEPLAKDTVVVLDEE
jgi:hypothetical protein